MDYGSTSTNEKSANKSEVQGLLADDELGSPPDAIAREAAEAKPHVPGQNPCLYLFHVLEGVAVATTLCLMATQILPLFLVPAKDIVEKIGVLSLALKVYISFFLLIFVITELDLPVPLVTSSPLLQNYASRGVLYSFIGLICVEESYSERVKDLVAHGKDEFHIGWASIFMQISSWLMLVFGLVYLLLGICCMKRLRDRMKENERQAWRDYREAMREWKTKYGE